jgi:hypothetical protein
MSTVHQKLFLAQLLDSIRPAVLTARTATSKELDELISAVKAGAEQPDTVFLQARMHQVSGRRGHP